MTYHPGARIRVLRATSNPIIIPCGIEGTILDVIHLDESGGETDATRGDLHLAIRLDDDARVVPRVKQVLAGPCQYACIPLDSIELLPGSDVEAPRDVECDPVAERLADLERRVAALEVARR